jgi:aminopeptidase N
LFSARESVRALIGEALREPLRAWVERPEEEPFTPDATSAGRRAMKATALDLLAAADGGAEIIERAFKTATSMTATMAALEALAACRSAQAAFDGALETFYLRWRAKPLVIDKWFSVQAAAPHDGGERAAALRSHPDFTLANPNRVRALAGAFATRNVRAFHAVDGSGYQFLAELVAQIDPLNPALAARLAAAFETWRRFDPLRKSKARAALEGLARRPGASRNLQEVVSRALAD